MAGGARMIWDCLTCYQCQENCPQQVEVCDLLYDLKNMAAQERVSSDKVSEVRDSEVAKVTLNLER